MKTEQPQQLRRIKLIHTIVWALLVGCILAIPAMAWQRNHGMALLFVAIVTVECLVLAFNNWRCPLTDVAARYTDARDDNFDIYLPLWLARYNKHIFGVLFVGGLLFAFARWRAWL